MFLLAGGSQAGVLMDVSGALNSGDPTQTGRLSRNGVPQDWAQTELYPGVLGAATNHYRTYAVPVIDTPYVQVTMDSTSPSTFVSAYLTSYNPANFATNWLGDPGRSSNLFFGTDPLYFNVVVPTNSMLVILVNETAANAGLNAPFHIIVEGFTDRVYTSSDVLAKVVLTSNNNPAAAGSLITLTATVTQVGTPPAGTVNFLEGASVVGSCSAVPLSGGPGFVQTAQCMTSTLPPGTHNLTAVYMSSARSATSSAPLSQVVNAKLATTTAVIGNPNPATQTSFVLFTATVTGGSSPTGTVAFKDGANVIAGCAAVPLSGGTAACNSSPLSPGPHTISAIYSGDLANATSTGTTVENVTCTGRGCT